MSRSERESRRAPARVFVVDDDAVVASMVRDVLRAGGHDVDVHAGGDEAVDVAAEGGYDLVISDYAIPAMNGVEFARRLGEIQPTLPVLLLTGHVDGELDHAVAGTANVVGVVRKPFDVHQLLRRVSASLEPSRARSFRSATG